MAKDEAAYLDHLVLYRLRRQVAARADLPKDHVARRRTRRETSKKLKSLPETRLSRALTSSSPKRAADVLTRFDLGTSALFPVEMLKRGKKEAFDGTYYIVHVSESKEGFEPNHSENFRKPKYGDEDWLGIVYPERTLDDQIAVNGSVFGKPDMWRDPGLKGSLFFSDALYQALMDADVLGNAETIRCRVI